MKEMDGIGVTIRIHLIFGFLLQYSMLTEDMTMNLIKDAGYPVETFYVQTTDGYVLKLHRIPKGIKELHYNFGDSKESKETIDSYKDLPQESVLLVHGLSCSSTMWVAGDKQKNLAFMLADSNYDVWLFNARGTTYSMGHKTLLNEDPEFWDFSFHEIGYYDIPAVINYVLRKNGGKRLRYVGHSQGTTVVLIALSTRPEYNSKLSSIYLLTPAAYMKRMSSLVRAAVPSAKEIQSVATMLHIYALHYGNAIFKRVSQMICRGQNSSHNILCSDMLFRIVGGDSGQLNKTTVFPILSRYVMDNLSLKQLAHFAQLAQAGKFQMYDYEIANYKYYGKSKPPEYNLAQISVPVRILYGSKDALVNSNDIEYLISKLKNIKGTVKLPWNHLDFILGTDVDVLVNDYIIRTMKQDAKELVMGALVPR